MHQVNSSWSFWMMKCLQRQWKTLRCRLITPYACAGSLRWSSRATILPIYVHATFNTDQMLLTNTWKQLPCKYAFINNVVSCEVHLLLDRHRSVLLLALWFCKNTVSFCESAYINYLRLHRGILCAYSVSCFSLEPVFFSFWKQDFVWEDLESNFLITPTAPCILKWRICEGLALEMHCTLPVWITNSSPAAVHSIHLQSVLLSPLTICRHMQCLWR